MFAFLENLIRYKRIPNNMANELYRLRDMIDSVDGKILALLAQRAATVSQIADYKKQYGLAVCDEQRERELITEKRLLAEELGLNPDTIERLYEIILEDSRRIQGERIRD